MNTEGVDRHLTTMIVRSYVQHHTVGTNQLSDLIVTIHRSLGQLGKPVQPEEVLTPAVSVRRSVHQDCVPGLRLQGENTAPAYHHATQPEQR
jgi:predicted transcriptional regulator